MTTATPKKTLHRLLDPVAECITPEVAQRILAISLDPAEQARADVLADKANEGLLTEAEREEYEEFIEAMDILGILKATARLFLSQPPRS